MDRFSLLLVIIGAINWGLVGLFQYALNCLAGIRVPNQFWGWIDNIVLEWIPMDINIQIREHLHALFAARDDAHDECACGRRERLTEAQKTEKLFSLPCGGEYFYHLSRSWATFAQKC